MDGLPPAAFLADSLLNLTTGLGTAKDRGVQSTFYRRASLTRDTIDALYATNWLGGKVVDIPADDACREWRSWKADKPVIEAIEAEERRLGVREKVNFALKLAAKDGGSVILLGDGGRADLPFDARAVRKGGLRWVHVLSRWEIGYEQIDFDPSSEFFGQPTMWRVNRPNEGPVLIHPSRVILFVGVPRADALARQQPWGDSLFERLHDTIRDATSAAMTTASLLPEAKVDVIKIPGLTENVVRDDYRAQVMQRFGLAMALKSLNNSLLLDAAEEWEQKTLTFQGLPEIINALLQIVAGAADMPVTRLLGRSPSGLNATGRSDLEAHYTMIRGRQETVLRPALERLDDALVRSALGRRPRGIFFEWRSLWSEPDADKAKTSHQRAMAIESLARSGVFRSEALQEAAINQLEEDGFLPGIGEAVNRFPGVQETPTNTLQTAGGGGGGDLPASDN